jgi:hypothetical protein
MGGAEEGSSRYCWPQHCHVVPQTRAAAGMAADHDLRWGQHGLSACPASGGREQIAAGLPCRDVIAACTIGRQPNSHGLAFLSVSTSRHRSSRSLFVVVPCLVCCLYLLWVALFLIHALFAASSSSCFVVNVKSDSSGRNLIVASSVSMSREFQGAAHFGRLYFQLGSRGGPPEHLSGELSYFSWPPTLHMMLCPHITSFMCWTWTWHQFIIAFCFCISRNLTSSSKQINQTTLILH